jgi:4-hydroxy-tetrahydrodipicolinate synthase
LYLHYKAVHDATNIPILLYNVPGRSAVDIGVDTIGRLAKLPRIIGIKECSGDVNRVVRTRAVAGSEFCQMTGDDPMMLPFLIQGGQGCISVTSNIAPKLCSDLFQSWKKKDIATLSALNDRLLPVHDAMFCETNPGPVKYAASLLGLCGENLRLPLTNVAATNKTKIETALDKAGIKFNKPNVQRTANQ